MIIRVYNNDGSDYCDYEGTVEENNEMCAERIRLSSWCNGWSEILDESDKE